jgi:helicase
MKRIDLGYIGEPFHPDGIGWDALDLPSKWRAVIEAIAPGSQPRDIQITALRDCRLLHSRRNVVVSGPTNSGKSLLGYLATLAGVSEGRRALLIEPFKALAEEKFDELNTLKPQVEKALGSTPQIEITTGDYRLNGETLMADPPQNGEIVIATPERIDAIMRNADFDTWVSSFGVICVDEAHLVGDERRGASLEGVMTRFVCEKLPPRFILLSATLGSCENLKEWLDPCDIAHSAIRRPPLRQEILVIDEVEKADDIVLVEIENALSEDFSSALVFVYRTEDATRLAKQIADKLRPRFGEGSAAAYHAKMPAARKISVKQAYETGKIRCLVSTTALGAGVNLPATHVMVRDLTFGRDGALPIRDLLQMMGRAGRGTRDGHSSVVLRPHDGWEQADLVEQIKNPRLPEVKSALIVGDYREGRNRQLELSGNPLAKVVLGQLVRRENQTIGELRAFFDRSLGGKEIGDHIAHAVRWLSDSQRILAWENEQALNATSLGKAVSRSGIPLEVGAGFASLIRDILAVDPYDKFLANWKPLDTLLVLELIDPRERGLKRFSNDLAEQVEDFIERGSIKTELFREWIRGAAGASKAEELLGSVGLKLEGDRERGEAARQYAYLGTMRAIIIYQLGGGSRIDDVTRRWKLKDLEGVEERWRDHLLWQVAGLAEILDIKCFYHFLLKECAAGEVRVARVKECFKHILHEVFDLMGMLRFCSPLGPLFRDLEAAKAGVGLRTKERLESAGIISFVGINRMTIDELRGIGIRVNIARKLKEYTRRRLA